MGNKNLQWRSKVVIVVQETGEIISKKQFEKLNYEIKRKSKIIIWGTTENTIEWRHEVGEKSQYRLFG